MWKFPLYEIDKPIDWDAMEATYDWFRDMRNVQQDAIWHAEGDVFVHTKMVVEELIQLPEFKRLNNQDKHILVASALMHDIEKSSTTTTEIIEGKERIVAPRHAKKGEFTVRKMLYQGLCNQDFQTIETPFEIREAIAKLVRNHGSPLWAITQENPQKYVIAKSLELNTEHVAMLAKADVLGRICEDTEDMLLRIALFEELCRENDCWGKPKIFESNYGRFLYLSKSDVAPNYKPFEDLKMDVYVMSALPGSGKDTFIQKHFDLPVLSLDNIRRANKISPTDKKKNGWVIQQAKEEAKQYLRKQKSFVFNATNITQEMRQKWISLFMDYKAKVHIIYIEVPYKRLKQQNHNRVHKVPISVIDNMIGKLVIPTFDEAHEIEIVT
ncbi:MAG: AAA family ATPase [Saprospiraceae bacterium]